MQFLGRHATSAAAAVTDKVKTCRLCGRVGERGFEWLPQSRDINADWGWECAAVLACMGRCQQVKR